MYIYNCKGDIFIYSVRVYCNIVDMGFCILFCLSVYIFVENLLI